MDNWILWCGVVVLAILPFVYQFLSRSKAKKQMAEQSEKRDQYLKQLKVKDDIVTVYGLYGTIHAIDDHIVTLKIAENTLIKIEKESIMMKISK